MAIGSYAELLSAVSSWLNREDLASVMPGMIALAEAEFNRTLRMPEMEVRSVAPYVGTPLPVPVNFNGMRSLALGGVELEYVSPSDSVVMLQRNDRGAGGYKYYTVMDEQFFFATEESPEPLDPVQAVVVYNSTIPALTEENPTNWLLRRHPDLYLFATLSQAEFYSWDSERLAAIRARVDQILSQLFDLGLSTRVGGKTLTMRTNVPGNVSRFGRGY